MKTFLSILTGILLAATLLSFDAGRHYYADILKQLSITEDEAQDYIFSNFREGDLSFPYSSAIKSLVPGKRAAAVKEMGDYIRQYTSSPAFLQHYREARAAAMPQGPAGKEEKIRARLAEIKHDIEQTEKDMKTATGDMRKLYEANLKMLQQQQQALQDPKHPEHAMFVSDVTGSLDDQNPAQYKEAMLAFEKDYPANPKDLIRSRLRAFLVLTADIDFNAQLLGSGRIKKFANPALEAKSGLWKKCFRSGKETITAARAYAQQWLKELN